MQKRTTRMSAQRGEENVALGRLKYEYLAN